MTTLHYLDFDYSDDTDDTCVFDAMASTDLLRRNAVQADIATVLDWAHTRFAGQRGPVEDGGEWDYDLLCREDVTTPQAIAYDEQTGAFDIRPTMAGPARWTFVFSVSGTSTFCAAFREQFGASVN